MHDRSPTRSSKCVMCALLVASYSNSFFLFIAQSNCSLCHHRKKLEFASFFLSIFLFFMYNIAASLTVKPTFYFFLLSTLWRGSMRFAWVRTTLLLTLERSEFSQNKICCERRISLLTSTTSALKHLCEVQKFTWEMGNCISHDSWLGYTLHHFDTLMWDLRDIFLHLMWTTKRTFFFTLFFFLRRRKMGLMSDLKLVKK